MADFNNLLGELEETPSLSVQDPAESYNDTTQVTDSYTDPQDHDAESDDADDIPAALQEALNLQENPNIIDDTTSVNGDAHAHEHENENELQYELLKRVWIQELNSTELCQYNDDVMKEFLDMLSMQEETMENLQNQPSADVTLASIAASVCKMDMDRLSFTLADLMRIRLEKIEKYPLHNRDVLNLMSEEEVRIAYMLQLEFVLVLVLVLFLASEFSLHY